MSNFNTPAPNASRSAISLGGEWRNRDQMEANKYKISGLASLHKKNKPRGSPKEKSRPRSTPTSQQVDWEEEDAPNSAPPGSRPRCVRVNEVESPEPTARKSLENHLSQKKPGSSTGSYTENMRQYELGPGMMMTKSKSRVAVTISTGGGDTPPPSIIRRQGSETPVGDPAKDALIFQLQQQVSDLTLYLEEERLNHKASKEKAGNLLREKLKELETKHREKFQRYQQDQEEQVAMLKEVQAKEVDHIKSGSEKALARMKGELEFLQGAFEAYKGTLTQDMVEKWTKKESDMKLKFHEEMENQLSEQRAELMEERAIERNAMNREFQKQMHIMSQENKREIEGLMKRFSGAANDVEKLRKAMDQLKAMRAELEQTAEALETSMGEAAKFKGRLTDAKMKLIDYQESFSGKVDEVDEKYKEKIHHLMTENAELRKRYMQKCNELFNEKSNTEYKRVEKVMNTKEMMRMLVHVRNRSNVSLACSDPATDAEPRLLVERPISAPSTRKEAHKAQRMAGETDHLSSAGPGLRRPHTTIIGNRPTPPREGQVLLNAFGSVQSLQSL